MDDNQIKYLRNMAAGKTSTGAAANQGQIKWANAQLAKIPQTTSVPKPTNVATPTSTVPKPATVPTPKTSSISTRVPSIPQGGSVPTPPTQGYSNPQLADWSQKQQEIFSRLEQSMNTPFQYDPSSDPAYQAQLQLSQQRAQAASRNALEAANDRGLLTSTLATNQLGQIQQAAEQEALSYIPVYREQAYNQYRNNLAQIGELLGQAYNLRNQQFNEGITEGQLTGTYLPQEAKPLVNQIYALKSQAETRGITAEERAQLSAQADQLRAQLSAMGVDISGIGADTSLVNARVGQRTIQGQQLDWQSQTDQRDFDESVRRYDQDFSAQQERYRIADEQWQQEYGLSLAQVTGYFPDGTPTSDQQQRELANLWTVADQTGVIPQQLASIYGLRAGTPTRAAKEFAAQLAIQQQNANANMLSSQASMMNAQTNRAQETRLSSQPRSSSSSNSNEVKLSSKESYNNYNILLDDMQKAGTKTKAMQLLQLNADYLNDSDYRKMMDYINNLYQ